MVYILHLSFSSCISTISFYLDFDCSKYHKLSSGWQQHHTLSLVKYQHRRSLDVAPWILIKFRIRIRYILVRVKMLLWRNLGIKILQISNFPNIFFLLRLWYLSICVVLTWKWLNLLLYLSVTEHKLEHWFVIVHTEVVVDSRI